MTTLHFNTDAGRETATALGTTRENLEAEVTALVNRVNGLVGSEWQGNSAVVFQGEMEAWGNQLRSQLGALSDLQSRLNTEISNWEATAANF